MLGVAPLLGRGFRAGDDVPGAEPVAVLSFGLWQELGGDPSIVGQRLTLDGTPRTVVGVMPRGFWFPDPTVRDLDAGSRSTPNDRQLELHAGRPRRAGARRHARWRRRSRH